MKTIFTKSCLVVASIICTTVSFSQVLTPGQAAKFGIDGDIRSDLASQGGFTAAGSHDWFKSASGTGLGILDTTGNHIHSAKISRGENYAFSKKMQFARYSSHDGILMLDGSYTRDYFGIGPSDALNDHTVFVANNKESNKNWQNPTTWTTIPTGGTIPNKADIIDSYVHMRRNGTNVSSTSFNDLVLTVGATTLSSEGDHYIDFEFYKERISYDRSTGLFSTPASSSTGGRSPWTFEGDGNIKLFGDICLSFSFNSSSVSSIMLSIWTDYNTYMKGKTARFSFVAGSWNGADSKGGYGYAQIVPNSGIQQVWGTVNLQSTAGPVWGTNSKEMGSFSGNFAATTYGAGQFAEAGINLTAFGIDPLLSPSKDPCNPPLTRFMVKTRSSSSFSSSLQDFTGPYEFLDAPTPSAKTLTPDVLTCIKSSVTLEPEVIEEGAYYRWTTPNGTISSGANTATATVTKPGDYTLTAAAYEGCATTFYTVKVKEEKYKPKAIASVSGTLSSDPLSFVTLIGDTATADNTIKAKGISWKWSGPSGFTSITKNTTTQLSGDYLLTVTETSTGCESMATARITANMLTLPVKFTNVSVRADKQKKVNYLNWKLADVAEAEKFVVEKSSNGIDFTPASYVFADAAYTAYSAKDYAGEKTVYYRIKSLSKSGETVYSSIVKAEGYLSDNAFTAFADASGVITLNYTAATSETLSIRVLNLNGQVLKAVSRNVATGSNLLKLTEFTKPATGMYLVLVQGQQTTLSAKLKW